MDRKSFIKICGAACLCGSAITLLLESCATNYYAKFTETKRQIIVKKSEFINQKDTNGETYPFIIVKPEGLAFPICVFHLGNSSYTALLMECTHNSCELQNQGQYLICPCHGSEFDHTGKVQNPPAEQNLKTYKTTSNESEIIIELE